MTERGIYVVCVFGLAYLVVAAYLSYQSPEHRHIWVQATLGIVVLGAVIVGRNLAGYERKRSGIYRALKVLVASYAVAFSMWMLISLLLLPVVGYAGILFVGSPLYLYVLIGVALVVLPFVAKRLA